VASHDRRTFQARHGDDERVELGAKPGFKRVDLGVEPAIASDARCGILLM
jgi:hypothetical protein